MNKKDIQANELNSYVKTCLAPSKIHGVGVHALRDLREGEKLYCDMIPKLYSLRYSNFNKLFPEVKLLLLSQWPQIINGSHFAYPTTRLQAHLNHSDNCNYNAKDDILLRDVKKGNEITENYKLIPNYDKIYTWLK